MKNVALQIWVLLTECAFIHQDAVDVHKHTKTSEFNIQIGSKNSFSMGTENTIFLSDAMADLAPLG